MDAITISAPAKVNTLLRVISKREDGYHDLQMVMVPLTLADEIRLMPIDSGIELIIDGHGDSGMEGRENLAWRAAAILTEASGRKDGVRIELTKRIPVAAGLGGGSSDAAAVLKGLNKLWDLGWGPHRLASFGKCLGADVPFFCYDKPAFVEGIGDIVSPFETFPDLFILLINPGFAVSTPWVYRQWDLQLTTKGCDARSRPLFRAFRDVVSFLHNDLEAVTIYAHPEIADIKNFLFDTGAAGALMSGSGPTVFGVFDDVLKRDVAFIKASKNESWRVFAVENFNQVTSRGEGE